MKNIYDLIIIGSGPAGLSAAVYALRARLNTLIIEKTGMSGGQILNTYEVDNYLGLPMIGGFDLGMKMREHVDHLDGQFLTGEVVSISENEQHIYTLNLTDGSQIFSKTVLIATGASHKHLDVEGEKQLTGKGVSYCATCDGAFFRDKTVAVVGGGNVAVEDALFLSKICKKVYIIHRRDNFRASKILSEKLLATDNIEPIWNSKVSKINGDTVVTSLDLTQVDDSNARSIEVNGTFIAVGMQPNTTIFKELVDIDESGYIIADETGVTSRAGIFVAGDVRTKQLRQVISAASDGANAITSIQQYLLHV